MAEFVRSGGAEAGGGITVQVGQKLPGPAGKGGISAAARDLGMTRQEVRRAQAIAALPETTMAAAEDLGLDDNQAALLAAARAEEPDEQVEVLEDDRRARQGGGPRDPDAKPLHNLVNSLGGQVLPLDPADHAQ